MDGNIYLLLFLQVWMRWARCLEEAAEGKDRVTHHGKQSLKRVFGGNRGNCTLLFAIFHPCVLSKRLLNNFPWDEVHSGGQPGPSTAISEPGRSILPLKTLPHPYSRHTCLKGLPHSEAWTERVRGTVGPPGTNQVSWHLEHTINHYTVIPWALSLPLWIHTLDPDESEAVLNNEQKK